MARDTKAIKDKLYPLVEKALSNSKISKNYQKFVNDFITKRDIDIYDSLPCSRILCGEDEMDGLFTALGISKATVENIIGET